MKFIVDAQILQATLANMEPELRGEYIMRAANALMAGKEGSWATKPPKPKSKAALGEYTEAFEYFWKCYPKKIGKGGAYAVWKKLTKGFSDMTLCELCCENIKIQCGTDQWSKDHGKFIPNPETYLNQRRWEDEVSVQAKTERYQDMNGNWQTR